MSVQLNKPSGGVIASFVAILMLLGAAAFVASPAQAAEKAVRATVAVSNDGTTVSFRIGSVHFVDTDGEKKNVAYSVTFSVGGETVFSEGVYSHGESVSDTFKVPQGTSSVHLRINQEGNDFDGIADFNKEYGLKWSTPKPTATPKPTEPTATPKPTEPTVEPTVKPTGSPKPSASATSDPEPAQSASDDGSPRPVPGNAPKTGDSGIGDAVLAILALMAAGGVVVRRMVS